MRHQAIVAMVALSLFTLPAFMGCDKTEEKSETSTKAPDGTKTDTTHKKEVSPNGEKTTTVDKSKTVTPKTATNP